MKDKKYFCVNVNQYVGHHNFYVYKPASLNNPQNDSVMFIIGSFMQYASAFDSVKNCLIFWPVFYKVPEKLSHYNAVVVCDNPHLQYCKFYQENNIIYLPPVDDIDLFNGAYIAKTAKIGKNATIFPGAYIGGEVTIGDNVYIGSGVKLVGEIRIGNNVVIRENSVVGADGLSTDRDEDGKAVTMPQFGGVILEDDVQVGANTVIGRGAIDNTVIHKGCKIDNCCFISHNVHLGADTFVVGESIMFGSSTTGVQAYISGNATIREGIHIGNKAVVGMGAVVTRTVPDGMVVKGNPAK